MRDSMAGQGADTSMITGWREGMVRLPAVGSCRIVFARLPGTYYGRWLTLVPLNLLGFSAAKLKPTPATANRSDDAASVTLVTQTRRCCKFLSDAARTAACADRPGPILA